MWFSCPSCAADVTHDFKWCSSCGAVLPPVRMAPDLYDRLAALKDAPTTIRQVENDDG